MTLDVLQRCQGRTDVPDNFIRYDQGSCNAELFKAGNVGDGRKEPGILEKRRWALGPLHMKEERAHVRGGCEYSHHTVDVAL